MKKLFKAVIFCVILAFLLVLINKILMPDTDFRADTRNGCEEVDYIMLGASNVFYSVNPAVIWNETGYVGYDLSTEQAPLIISYYQLKNELKTVKPKTVFLDCIAFEYNYGIASMNQLSLDKMDLSLDKMSLILNLGEDDKNHRISENPTYDKINYVFPLYKFHDRWKEIFEGTIYSKYHEPYEHVFMGYVATKKHFVYEKDYKWMPTSEELGGNFMTEITELNRNYVEKIKALCEENNIELVLFKSPTKLWTVEIDHAVRKLASEENLKYFNMNEAYILNEMGIDDKKDLCDDSCHFNIYGTEKVSKWIAAYMQDSLNFADKRVVGTDTNAVWNSIYQEYMDFKNSEE